MSARKPLLYLGIFLALAAFYYFYEHKGGQERTEQEEQEKKALLFSPDSVDSFSFCALGADSVSSDTVSLARENGSWWIVFPLRAEADSEAVARLLSSASGADRNRVVEDSAADLSIFGLDRPSLVFEVTFRPGAQVQRLALGRKNPGDTYVYAANLDQPRRVLLLNSWVLSDLQKDVFALRDKKVLRIAKTAVGRLVVLKAGEPALEVSREAGDWKLTKPFGGLADRDSVENLIDKLVEARAEAFVDSLEAGSPAALELDRPAWTVQLYEKQSGALYSLEVGGVDEKGRYYARRGQMQPTVLLAADVVGLLGADPGRLRDLRLLAASRDSIVQIALENADGAWQADKDSAGAWSFARPERAKADGSRIDGYLLDLKDLQARRFVAAAPELNRLIGRPEFTLTLTGDRGSETLAFVRSAPADSLYYVKSSRLDGLAVVDSASAGRLKRAFHDLRLRKVTEFETGRINRVRIERQGKEAIELAGGEDKWKITSPTQAEAESWKVQNLLWDIADVEFDSVLSATSSDSAAFGFASPRARVLLWKDDSLLAAVSLADSVAGGRRVALRSAGDTRTLAVDGKILGEIVEKTDELEKKK
ncbi:MAG: DUF4340 domain-containing protein [Candidatus Glassbacteria bacterium]